MSEYQFELDDFFVSSGCCSPEQLLAAFKAYGQISGQLKSDDPLIFKDILSGVGGNALFRRGGTVKEAETFLWLSHVQRLAEKIVATGKVPLFENTGTGFLREIAKLSLDERNLENVSRVLLGYGVVLIYLPQTAGMRTDGALFKLSSGAPVIGLTIRYDRYDYYWFTLMHELAHLVLHADRFDEPHFDCIEDDEAEAVELEANQAARDSFISRSEWRTASVRRYHSEEELLKCARQLSIHPAILAGMVRYETGDYSLFNSVVREIDVRGIIS